MLDAKQPDTLYLEHLNKALTGNYVINYVEFAMDIMSHEKATIKKLRRFINEVLIFERERSSPRFYHATGEKIDKNGKKKGKNTHYFGLRYKHPHVLVVYSDKPSKTDGESYCVHIEMRLYGSETIKDHGIYTIPDLIDHSHSMFWDTYIDLRSVSHQMLGRLAYPRKNLQDSTYLRQGQKIVSEYRSSQHLLTKNPEFSKAFSPIKNRRMLESRLSNALR